MGRKKVERKGKLKGRESRGGEEKQRRREDIPEPEIPIHHPAIEQSSKI